MMSKWKEGGGVCLGGEVGPGGEVLKLCHVFQDFFVFKQNIYCPFSQMEGVGGHIVDHFL